MVDGAGYDSDFTPYFYHKGRLLPGALGVHGAMQVAYGVLPAGRWRRQHDLGDRAESLAFGNCISG